MSEEMKRCPFCGEEILVIAKKCKYCKSELPTIPNIEKIISNKNKTPSKVVTPKKKPFPWGIVVFVVIIIFLFFSNFHIITGGSVGHTVVKRDYFGFREIFINIDAITNMPWIAAKSQFPIGCLVLAREGIIESDEAFKLRITREAEKLWDGIEN